MKLDDRWLDVLRCPQTLRPLHPDGDHLVTNDQDGPHYPVVDGVPVLLDESSSIFRVSEIVQGASAAKQSVPEGLARRFRKRIERAVPSVPDSGISAGNYARFRDAVSAMTARPRVLVIGGGEGGQGFDELRRGAALDIVESDVRVTSRGHLVCDAHRLPFADQSLHGVVAQAVLEHVLDPFQCVSEMHRVLVPDGIVYAETPFMQQVHMGRYDFTRFTYLGHRRLFRNFAQLSAGAVCGPGMVVRWALEYYVRSVTRSRDIRWLGSIMSRLATLPLELQDSRLMRDPKSWDAASAYFFLGRRSETPLTDAELLASYPG